MYGGTIDGTPFLFSCVGKCGGAYERDRDVCISQSFGMYEMFSQWYAMAFELALISET